MFASWGAETIKSFTLDEVQKALAALADEHRFGTVLRAKGIVAGEGGNWIHFDYVPDETNVRVGAADVIGKICVIGASLDESALKVVFGV